MESQDYALVADNGPQEESEEGESHTEEIEETSVVEEEEYEEEKDESFKNWLKDVSECLRGFRKVDPDKMQQAAEEEREEESDEDRSMRIVKSVLGKQSEKIRSYSKTNFFSYSTFSMSFRIFNFQL